MKNSNIEWTDHTFNPWEGCTKVSPGCLHCYAETRNKRWNGGLNWGKGAPRRRTSASNWAQPVKWNREAEEKAALFPNMPWARAAIQNATHRPRVFCASLADWLDAEVDPTWRHDLLELIRTTPNLDWLLLTKRPENFQRLITHAFLHAASLELRDWAWTWLHSQPPVNVWIGISTEDQERYDRRIDDLNDINAGVKFLSVEPMIGPVVTKQSDEIDWIICGGESGPGAREMKIEWARDLRDQAKHDATPFFMKQLGGVSDKRGALEDLPEDLRIREFPTP